MFPVPVTNQTFLQFKIDELYSNAAVSEGNHCQYLEVKFNQGYKIIYSEQSQFCPYIYDPYRERAAYRTFSVGYGIMDNIFKAFGDSGISVPGKDFSLNGIMLYQNHWLLPEPSSRE
ncbi:MAG: hypothetical protein NTY64_16475, partial [Deltaproteobacteria bacterium]|nr:hypothetical protein [Deltaproteobacteria bacterium]